MISKAVKTCQSVVQIVDRRPRWDMPSLTAIGVFSNLLELDYNIECHFLPPTVAEEAQACFWIFVFQISISDFKVKISQILLRISSFC